LRGRRGQFLGGGNGHGAANPQPKELNGMNGFNKGGGVVVPSGIEGVTISGQDAVPMV
jgi:hypothetical protein